MKRLFILLLSIFYINSYAQCDKKILSGTFENIKYTGKCPMYAYSINSSNFDYIKHPFEKGNLSLVEKEFQKIDSLVRNTILKTSSNYFKENLNFYSLDITYKDSINNFQNIVPKPDLDKCKAKYSIYYYFEPIKNVKYCVGFAFDENLNWIKEDRISYLVTYDDEFSKKVEYPSYENVLKFEETTICDLLELGKHYLNNDVKDLELVFLNNSFFWKMNEVKQEKAGENIVKSVLINTSNLADYLIKDDKIYISI